MSQDPEGNETVTKPEINKEQVVTMQSLSNHQVIVKLSLSIPNIGELLRKMFSPMSTKKHETCDNVFSGIVSLQSVLVKLHYKNA